MHRTAKRFIREDGCQVDEYSLTQNGVCIATGARTELRRQAQLLNGQGN